MKKTFIALLCMVAGLQSCSNDENSFEGQKPADSPMTFNISVNEIESISETTRATKASWVNGDKIYIFFNGLANKYLILTYNGSTWTNASGGNTLESTDFSGLSDCTLTAVHFPVAVDVAYADNKFTFTSSGKPVYNYYLYETGSVYTMDGSTITATLSMSKPADIVQFHVAGIQANVSDYIFGCPKIKPVACKSVGTDGTITEEVLQPGACLSGFADSDGGIFAGRLTSPGVSADYKFTIVSNDYLYTLTRTEKTLTAGKMYNFPELSQTGGTNWTVSDLYVDLGLSVKWARCNIGAANETEFGDYFAWGETETKTDYTWNNYKWGSGIPSKYNGVDKKTVLDLEDDVAHVRWGSSWRMPTFDEQEELINNCTWTLYSAGNTEFGGVFGFKATSNKVGYTDRFIFLPVPAEYVEDEDESYYRGECRYWSSSLFAEEEFSSSWYLNLGLLDAPFTEYNGRVLGYPVRPVRP